MKQINSSQLPLLKSTFKTLCSPWANFSEENIICCKQFTEYNFTISLRYFYPPTDLLLVQEWIMSEYNPADKSSVGLWPELLQVYTNVQQSNTAQAFMSFKDNVPVCLIEVAQAVVSELSFTADVKEEDYVITLLLNQKEKGNGNLYIGILQVLLEYFFSYQEVKRVLIETHADDTPDKKLLSKAGFRLLKNKNHSVSGTLLYACSSEMFVKEYSRK